MTAELVPVRAVSAGGSPVDAGQSDLARPRLVSPASVALALATPATTVPLLALSRYWSSHGAYHSIGDMVPLTLGGIVAVAGAVCSEDAVLTGTCVAAAGSCIAVGAMAYPGGLVEPLIATLAMTVFGWVFTRRVARANRAAEREHADRQAERDSAVTVATINGQTALGVATIQGQTALGVARINGAAAVAVADRNVIAATRGASFSGEQVGEAWAHRRAMESGDSALLELEAASEPVDDWLDLSASLGLGVRR